MSNRNVTLLSGDGRTREVRYWKRWLHKVPSIRRQFCAYANEFDPLHFNEAASVAVLANAASKAGYLALTEYVVQKRQPTSGRPFRHGRCDLWLADGDADVSWAFEFKQHFATATIRTTTFEGKLQRAHDDARRLDRTEADRRFGCLIVVPRHGAAPDGAMTSRIDQLCSGADVAFRIGGGVGAVWLAFTSAD